MPQKVWNILTKPCRKEIWSSKEIQKLLHIFAENPILENALKQIIVHAQMEI